MRYNCCGIRTKEISYPWSSPVRKEGIQEGFVPARHHLSDVTRTLSVDHANGLSCPVLSATQPTDSSTWLTETHACDAVDPRVWSKLMSRTNYTRQNRMRNRISLRFLLSCKFLKVPFLFPSFMDLYLRHLWDVYYLLLRLWQKVYLS